MRLCRDADELEEAFAAVQRLSQASFKDSGIFAERFVERARHIEVQIFGDGAGRVVALGERDCSAQRRNQKVMEETPAPGLTAASRAALFKAAVRLGEAVQYRNAGTVEFIYDSDRGEFYFLEVNTRLQVEHGVTECGTGIDLMAWMVRLAAGENPIVPVQSTDASIQVRVYAESPLKDFVPCPGELTLVEWPSKARVETWVESGTDIPPYYDPLLAKIIVHGETREEAVRQMAEALAATKLGGGVPTTAGCPAYAYSPAVSATVVLELERAGAVATGKTNLDQFATGLAGVRSPYGACSSVFDKEYISGGSSSGSAVAVASGQVDFALGTGTAGSGRVPAAFNNLAGLKPTRGVLSMTGVVPACRSLDTVSILTRDVETVGRVFDAAAQYDPADWSSRRMEDFPAPWARGKFRFGVPRPEQLEFFGGTAAAQLYDAAIAKLETSGGDEMHPVVRGIINGASRHTAVDSYRALYRLGELKRAAEAAWRKMDVLFLPAAGTIYKIAEVEADPVRLNTNLGYYTNFVNLFDLAALAIPAGFRPNGLPFGVTLIGPAFSDRALLALAGRPTVGIPGCLEVAVVGAH